MKAQTNLLIFRKMRASYPGDVHGLASITASAQVQRTKAHIVRSEGWTTPNLPPR